jgi:hypothetical protein
MTRSEVQTDGTNITFPEIKIFSSNSFLEIAAVVLGFLY